MSDAAAHSVDAGAAQRASSGGVASFGDRRRAAVSTDLDPWDLLRAIWARKERLAVLFAIFFAIGAFLVLSTKPTYQAETRLSIQPRTGEISRFDERQSPPSADRSSIESEIQILTSGALVPDLVREMDLHETSEFNPARSEPGAVSTLFQLLVGSSDPRRTTMRAITDRVLSELSVSRQGDSRVIAIRFSSSDPDRAADLANTYAQVYLNQQVAQGNAIKSEATAWLEEQIQELRNEVALSEAAVEQFRGQTGLFQTGSSTLPRDELSQLNAQLVQARADRSAVTARLELAGQLVEDEDAIDTTAEVLQSGLIQNLRQQEVSLKAQIAEMSATLLPTHPRVQTAQANLHDLRLQIGREVAKVIRGLENEAQIANQRVRSLQANVNDLKRRMTRLGQQEVELRALEREAAANRTLLEQFLARYEAANASAAADAAVANAIIISRATVPTRPSAPNKKSGLVLAVIGSAFGALAVVFLLEAMAPGFRTPEQIERQTGMPFIGIIPRVSGPYGAATIAADVVHQPYGRIAEGLRRLQSNLLMARIGNRQARSVLVTSTGDGEQKTGVAAGLARLMAQGGYRVLLIDADLRRPAVSHALGVYPSWGLSELLSGQAEFERLITRDPGSNLHILQAGGRVTNPTALLGSSRMNWLMYALMQNYDYIIIDGPSVSSGSEAPVLSQVSDVTVMCVQWAKTNRRLVQRALKNLSAASTRRVGVLLTDVDLRRYDRLADDTSST